MKELYKTLGEAKCEELAKRSWGLWHLLDLAKNRKNTNVMGVVMEGLAKDFIREFLPVEFGLKSGLIFDSSSKTISPQIDAIVYKGVPLLEYTDAVIVEKEQVRAAFEIKSVITQSDIFGTKSKSSGDRDSNSGLASQLSSIKNFLAESAVSILFTFELHSGATDKEVINRLGQICDRSAVVLRREPLVERRNGKEGRVTDFEDSISALIEWLRKLK